MIGKSSGISIKMVALLAITLSAAAIFPGFALATDPTAQPSENASHSAPDIFLDIYLDEGALSRSLISGYLYDPDILVLPVDAQVSFDNQTGQIFVLTDSLIESDGMDRTVKMDASNYIDRLQLSFFLPPSAGLTEIIVSQGLSYLLSEDNGAPMLEVHGFEVEDPYISISYQIGQ